MARRTVEPLAAQRASHFPKPVGRAPLGSPSLPVRLPAASGPSAFLGVDKQSGRCGTRTHDLSRVNPSWVVSVTWGSYGKSSSEGK